MVVVVWLWFEVVVENFTEFLVKLSSFSCGHAVVVVGLISLLELFERDTMIVHHTESFFSVLLAFLSIDIARGDGDDGSVLRVGFLVLSGSVDGLSANLVGVVDLACAVSHLTRAQLIQLRVKMQ